MAESDLYISSGPTGDFSVPNQSIGKYMFDCLKKWDSNRIVNIDAATGNILTSGELVEKIIKATTVLRDFGIKKDDVIALISENSLNYIVPIIASLCMGVTVNLLNPSYVADELKHAFSISLPKLILCSEVASNNVLKVKEHFGCLKDILLLEPTSNTTPYELQSFCDLLESIPVDEKNFKTETFDISEQGAFIILSSGTTGLPKGALITHQNLIPSFHCISDPFCGNASQNDVSVYILPFFHIFGLMVYLGGVAIGMKYVIMSQFKPDLFLKSIEEYKATKLYVVPPLLLFLCQSPLVKQFNLSSINDIIVGGAPLAKEFQDEAIQRMGSGSLTIRQVYGSTEVTGACSFQRTSKNKPGSIGHLIRGMDAKVFDNELKVNLGPMKVGELCFRGSMILKAYLGNSAATENAIDEYGFYHSGDMGYYDEDGCFYIQDRVKDLIKYKGFQVAPAELESLIMKHPAVSDCGVIGIPNERAGQVPLAFVVRREGADVTEHEIVDYVAERISVQKHLYGGVIFIENIPKTSSGKILRRLLLELYSTQK